MFPKWYLITLFTIIVTCESINKDQLLIQINDKAINMGYPTWHSKNNINIYNTTYDYVENRKLTFTCKYINVPGKCHRMMWVGNNKTLKVKFEQPYNRETDSITVDWTPTNSSVLKCQIYVGIDDTEECNQTAPKFIAILRFRPQQNVETNSGGRLNEFSILGLEKSNILDNSTDRIKYKFKDGDTLNLTCTFKPQNGQFHMTWFKNGSELAKTPTVPRKTTRLDTVIHLNKTDDKSKIQCNITENTSDKTKKQGHKTIELVYESVDEELNVTTEMTVIATDVATYSRQSKENIEYKNIIYLILILLAVIIIVIIIVLLTKHYKKNRKKEDKRTLQGSSSDTNWEDKCPDTYSNPADTMNTNAVYSSPYKGVVYSTPIPKNARVANKIEYENLSLKHKIPHNVTDKTCYENSINFNTTYANLDDENSNQYSNTLCSGNNGSDMYSYIVVDK